MSQLSPQIIAIHVALLYITERGGGGGGQCPPGRGLAHPIIIQLLIWVKRTQSSKQ